jgi:hypothetical protein
VDTERGVEGKGQIDTRGGGGGGGSFNGRVVAQYLQLIFIATT